MVFDGDWHKAVLVLSDHILCNQSAVPTGTDLNVVGKRLLMLIM